MFRRDLYGGLALTTDTGTVNCNSHSTRMEYFRNEDAQLGVIFGNVRQTANSNSFPSVFVNIGFGERGSEDTNIQKIQN